MRCASGLAAGDVRILGWEWNRICGIAGNGIGRLSRNGVVGGLAGMGVGAHNTGSATPVCPNTLDFFDVRMVGLKMVTAPAAAPILIMSLLVNLEASSFEFGAFFFGIRVSFQRLKRLLE
jgi:hypothetical protein